MVEAVVEFDYTAQEPDELTIRKGDKISDVKTLPGGWWEGMLSGKRGMFPDNFVQIMSKTETTAKSSQNDVTLRSKGGRRCKVLYSYQPANEDELQLTVDDVIEVIAEVEDGWWKGSLREMVGVFPSNFVSEIFGEEARRPRPGSRDEAGKVNDSKSSESDCDRSTSVSSPDSSQLFDSSQLLSSTAVGNSDSAGDVPSLPPKPVRELCRALFAYEAANGDELTLREGDVVTLVSREVQDKGWWRGELRGHVGLFPDNFVELLPAVAQQPPEEQPPRKPERSAAVKSPLVTTNRARDSITKPPTPKSDLPPVPGKKPQVSLAGKKTTDRVAVVVPFGDVPDGAGPSRASRSCDLEPSDPPSLTADQSEPSEFDNVARSAMLSHPTAGRAKAPGRRPPSTTVLLNPPHSPPHSPLTNGTTPSTTAANDSHDEPSKKLWEKSPKAPWMEELKLNQSRKTSQPEPPTAINAVRTANSRPQSMYGDMSNLSAKAATSPPLKLSRKTTIEIGAVTSTPKREPPAPMSKSLNSSISTISPASKSMNSSISTVSPASKSLNASISTVSPAKPDSPAKVVNSNSAKAGGDSVQELKATVARLQASLEQQRDFFAKSLLDLAARLDEESRKRTQIEQQLNKLTDLVTQV